MNPDQVKLLPDAELITILWDLIEEADPDISTERLMAMVVDEFYHHKGREIDCADVANVMADRIPREEDRLSTQDIEARSLALIELTVSRASNQLYEPSHEEVDKALEAAYARIAAVNVAVLGRKKR